MSKLTDARDVLADLKKNLDNARLELSSCESRVLAAAENFRSLRDKYDDARSKLFREFLAEVEPKEGL